MSSIWRRTAELMTRFGMDYLRANKKAQEETQPPHWVKHPSFSHIDWCSSHGPYLSKDCTCPCQGCGYEIDNYPGHMHNKEFYEC